MSKDTSNQPAGTGRTGRIVRTVLWVVGIAAIALNAVTSTLQVPAALSIALGMATIACAVGLWRAYAERRTTDR